MSDSSVTDEQLRTEIANILKDADLLKTSTKKVIKQLEEKFKTSLTSKKSIIDKMVLDFINSMTSEEEEEEEEKKVSKKEAEQNEEDGEDKEEEEEEEEEPPKKKRSTRSKGNDKADAKKPAKRSKKNGKDEGGGRSGYTRAYKLSPALSELMGAEEMSRHEVVKRMWAIIKEKKMYDPNNKQFTICDDALYKVIGTKRFRTFGMMKYLKSHFIDE